MLGRRLSQESSGVPVGSSLCSSSPSQLLSKTAVPKGGAQSQQPVWDSVPWPFVDTFPVSLPLPHFFLFPQICVPNLLVPLTTSNPGLQTVAISSYSLGPKHVNQSACHPWLFLPCQSSPNSVLPPHQQKVLFLLNLFYFLNSHS